MCAQWSEVFSGMDVCCRVIYYCSMQDCHVKERRGTALSHKHGGRDGKRKTEVGGFVYVCVCVCVCTYSCVHVC